MSLKFKRKVHINLPVCLIVSNMRRPHGDISKQLYNFASSLSSNALAGFVALWLGLHTLVEMEEKMVYAVIEHERETKWIIPTENHSE